MTRDDRFRPGPLALLGLFAVVVGLASLVVTEIAAGIGLTQAFVTIVGAFAALQGGRYALSGRKTDRIHVDFGDPERRSELPTPGDRLDRELEHVRSRRRGHAVRRRNLQSRLRGTAATVIAIRSNHSRADALELIDGMEWPGDRVATAFLANERFPVTARLRAFFGRESTHSRAIRRTVEAIEREWNDPSIESNASQPNDRERSNSADGERQREDG